MKQYWVMRKPEVMQLSDCSEDPTKVTTITFK